MPRKRVDHPPDDPSTTTTIRLKKSELDEIRSRSKRLGLTLTDYLIRRALGQPTGDDSERRFDEVERRLDRLEHMAQLGSFE